MSPVLSKKETVSMRGVAIIFIVLHNLLHVKMPTVENEFIFSLSRSTEFAKHMLVCDGTILMDIFSFLGWYGVPVFLFLSGYGLTLKYGYAADLKFETKRFVWKHIKSVYFLMLIPYLPLAVQQIRNDSLITTFLQTAMLGNIVCPDNIFPGIFWYFGLIFQIYMLFALLRHFCSPKNRNRALILINIISLIYLFCLAGNNAMLYYVKHNFVGWLLPFSMGVWFAQNDSLKNLFDSIWKNFAWLIVAGLLVAVSNFCYYTWVLSPVLAVMASIGLTKILSYSSFVDKICVWFGALSAFLFAVHPLVRYVIMRSFWDEILQPFYIVLYFLASIVAALIYRYIHQRLFNH